METINVTVWNEYIHERSGRVAEIYPGGIHGAIAEMLGRDKKYNIRTATLDMPENGLSEEVLDNTDVLIRWGTLRARQSIRRGRHKGEEPRA